MDGTQIVHYTYDAWGNQKVEYLATSGEKKGQFVDISEILYHNANSTIATQNPFRYRSYYYNLK